MKELWKNLKGWQKAGILVGCLILIVIIVVSVVLANKPPKVKIVFAEKNNIPGSEIAKIENKLIKVVENNSGKLEDFTTYEGNATNYNEKQNGEKYTANFVVDFDVLKESYKVDVTWPDPNDGSPNIGISCALLAGKYPETPCKTELNSSSELVSYLPYTGELADGETYKITAKYSGEKMYLEIKTSGNIEEAVAAAKKWMQSLGFEPDDYLLYAPSKQYIQINHAKTNDANVNKYLPYFMPGAYDVYPVVDGGTVTTIHADIAGCTDYQTTPVEEQVTAYLNNSGINYPVEWSYCAN